MTAPPPPHSLTPRVVAASALLAVALMLMSALPTPAAATPVESTSTRLTPRVMTHGQTVVADQINRARTARNRRSIAINGLMRSRAQNWAEHLRACQCLQHRAAPFGTPSGWCAAAENVGRSGNGNTLGSLHDAFMRSSGHRDNILNTRWTALGVGVAKDRHGEYFVVHAFADFSC